MTEIDELRSQIEDLSRRLQGLEDHIAITQVVARYGPAVDSGSADAAADLWTDDGAFEVPPIATWTGHDEIAGMLNGDGHQGLIRNGCAHVLTVPHVIVDGDDAKGWSYALNIRWDAGADRFWVARVSANAWTWRRTDDGWKVVHRTNHSLDGSEQPRVMLRESTTA
jgi:ketosteroid isomerase-like protein